MLSFWSMGRFRFKRFFFGLIGLTVFFCLKAEYLAAQDSMGWRRPKFWERDYLTGNWGGLRSKLTERGITLELTYTGDVFGNPIGGLERIFAYLDNIDIVLTFDAGKRFGWRGTSFSLYGLGNHGGHPSRHIRDAQGVNNIEAFNTWKIYEAWVQQNLLGNRLSLLLGLYDVNTEFDVIQAAGLFINSSFGIGPDIAQSGKNGPSIFPYTSVGLRTAIKPKRSLVWRTAILDGVPGHPEKPGGTHIHFGRHDGFLFISEVALLRLRDSAGELGETRWRRHIYHIGRRAPAAYRTKLAFGGWFYTEKVDEHHPRGDEDAQITQSRNFGFYAFAEHRFMEETIDPAQGLAGFIRYGIANPNVNHFSSYLGAGLVYKGLIPGRAEDQLGFGIASAHTSALLRRFGLQGEQPLDKMETVLELIFHTQLFPFISAKVDVQYVINPGTLSSLKNALVLGTRLEVAF